MPALATALSLSLLLSPPAGDCECTPASPAEALAAADFVFTGKLVAWSGNDHSEGWGFRPERTWKRELPWQVAISVEKDGCPISFGEIGDEWLIYATIETEEEDKIMFRMADCPRMVPLASADVDIAILDGKPAGGCGCGVSEPTDAAALLGFLAILGGFRRRRQTTAR